MLFAAAQTIGHARYQIARCFYEGNVVPQDLPTAYKWFLLAKEDDQTDDVAHYIDLLDHQLSPQELASAENAAKLWHRHPFDFQREDLTVDLGGSPTQTIPFQYVAGNIVILGSVGKLKVPFILDTGTPTSAITQSLAEELGLMPALPTVKGALRIPCSFSLGSSVHLSNVRFITSSHGDSSINSLRCVPRTSGLLGYDILRYCTIRVDYANQTITFIKTLEPDSSPFLPIVYNFYPFINVSLVSQSGKSHMATLIFDTGAYLGVCMKRDYASYNNSTFTIDNSIPNMLLTSLSMPKVPIGSINLLDMKIAKVPDAPISVIDYAKPKYTDGVLGNTVLERFIITLDAGNNRLYLLPNRNFNEPFDYYELGFTIKWSSATQDWIVSSVGQVGHEICLCQGLQVGDHIIGVNTLSGPNLTIEYIRNSLYTQSESSILVSRGGITVSIPVKFAPDIPLRL